MQRAQKSAAACRDVTGSDEVTSAVSGPRPTLAQLIQQRREAGRQGVTLPTLQHSGEEAPPPTVIFSIVSIIFEDFYP